MANRTTVNIKWNRPALNTINQKTMRGLVRIGFDISAQARRNAPYVTGALRNTIRVTEVEDNSVEVKAGGTFAGFKVDYAWIREQGPNRNPATEHYMENAMNFILSGDYMKKYFGDIT